MANRTFQTVELGLIKRRVALYPTVSVGGAGAVTLQKRTYTAAGTGSVAARSSLTTAPTTGIDYAVGDGAGVRSVARTGTGLWTITLSDPYQYLLGVRIAQTSKADGIPTCLSVGVVSGSTNVATNTATGNGGVIAIALADATNQAADPESGDVLTLEILLGDASEP